LRAPSPGALCDEPFLRSPLSRARRSIPSTADQENRAGDDWRAELKLALENTGVALFIVTPNLLASPFIRREEMRPLLDQARTRGVRILWVPVTASSYEETAFESMQAAMNPANPLDQMSEPQQHHALVNLCKVIKSAFEKRDG